jgi:hypothetical protein
VNELNNILQEKDGVNVIENEQHVEISTETTSKNLEISNDLAINFTLVELELLQLLRSNDYTISLEQFIDFTKIHNSGSSIIRNCNKKFFELYEENIIENGTNSYFISIENQQYLTN